MVRLCATLTGLAAFLALGCVFGSRSVDQFGDDELCVYYYINQDDPKAALDQLREPLSARSYDPDARKAAAAEIRRRDLIASEDWSLSEAGDVRVGMSRCGVLASLGVPTKVNPTDDMWIYHKPEQSSLYVSFKQGRVANAWAN
jgi:hypothetical protein